MVQGLGPRRGDEAHRKRPHQGQQRRPGGHCLERRTAGGAIQALAAQKLAGKVPIAGQDADIAACQRIVEGTQTGTVYKPLAKLNLAANQLALALAKGIDPKTGVDKKLGVWTKLNNGTKDVDSFSVDVVAVDKSNMMSVIIKDGFQKKEEVYKNVPKDQWPK